MAYDRSVFRVYGNKNIDISLLSSAAYEYGQNVSESQSAALTFGLLRKEIERQKSYVTAMQTMLESVTGKEIPDNPATHPDDHAVDMRTPFKEFVEDNQGRQKPVNESTRHLASLWLTFARELLLSNSAAVSGALLPADAERASENLKKIEERLSLFERIEMLDLPETAKSVEDLR